MEPEPSKTIDHGIKGDTIEDENLSAVQMRVLFSC